MKTLLWVFTLALSFNAFAIDYTMHCSNKKIGHFTVTFMDEDNEIQFSGVKLPTDFDDYIFPANYSPNYRIIKAWPSVSDYFNGSVEFYLGSGLLDKKVGQRFTIALTADDGDGSGFTKAPFSCQLRQISL